MAINLRALNKNATTPAEETLALSVTLVMKFCPLGNQSLTPLLPAALDSRPTILRLHSGTESVLALAAALGGLISAFHSFRKNG